MSSLEYKEKSKINVTKLIQLAYEMKNDSLTEMLKGMDFLEMSKKSFMIGNTPAFQSKYDVSESLAMNCINTLPLEMYKQFIKPTWVTSEGFNSFNNVHIALGAKKYDYLEELLTICTQYIDGTNKNIIKQEKEKLLYNYGEDLLYPILNIDHNLYNLSDGKQEDIKGYYELFKKSVNFLEKFLDLKYTSTYKESKRPIEEPINSSNWFKNYCKLTPDNYKSEKIENLIKYLICNPSNFFIYLDVFEQCSNSELNLFKNIDLYKKAYKSNNKKVIRHLTKEMQLTNEEILNVTNEILEEWIVKQELKFGRSKTAKTDKLDDTSYISKIMNLKKSLLPEEKEDNKTLVSLLYSDNKDFLKNYPEQYPQIKTEKLINNLDIYELIGAKEIFVNFLETQQLDTDRNLRDSEYLSATLHIISKLESIIVLDSHKVKEIQTSEKTKLESFVKETFIPLLSHIQINENESNKRWLAYILQNNLEAKNDMKQKIKI